MRNRNLTENGAAHQKQPTEHGDRNRFVHWSYHTIPMTLELARRKEEEELMEMYGVKKPKKAVIIKYKTG